MKGLPFEVEHPHVKMYLMLGEKLMGIVRKKMDVISNLAIYPPNLQNKERCKEYDEPLVMIKLT